MHEVAPYEFFMGKGNGTPWFTGLLSPGGKSNPCLIYGNDSAVGDGDLVCILPEIFNRIPKPVECLLDVRAPFLFIKAVLKSFPGVRLPEGSAGRRECKLSFLVKPVQEGKEFSLELIAEHKDGYKKLPFGYPELPAGGQPAPGDDAVHMHMVAQLLVPGMEHLYDAGCRPEVLGVCGKLQERFGAAPVQQPVKQLLVVGNQGVQLMRECKYHMEIRGMDHFSPAFVNPPY